MPGDGGAGRADEECPWGIPIRGDAQHTSTAHDPMEPLGLGWHRRETRNPTQHDSFASLSFTQHRERPLTTSVMLRHQSQISTSFMEGFMY